ncbi:MAG: SpoIIE family protein phosphatase [Acidobacteria bacterium]|nr:SpoIIE family protein phosphatase [Acidobacteriota bacterium]
MSNESSTLPRLAALLLAGVSGTYALGLLGSQSWDGSGIGWTLVRVWVGSVPFLFLVVALTVLFQRLHDRNAWVMALMFCGFLSLFSPQAAGASPVIPGFMMAYRMTLLMMAPGLFAFFFLVFPARSRLDERAPWLKWLLVGLGALLVLTAGPWRPLLGQPFSPNLAGESILSGRLALWRAYGVFGSIFVGIGIGILALIGHATRAPSSEVRRKARVLAWGTVAAVAPALSIAAVEATGRVPEWLAAVALFAFPLMPLSFAYAVVRHRVMTVPVLVRRGARYLLVQRGLAVVSVASSLVVAVVLAMLAQRWLPAGSDVGLPVAVVAAGLLGVGVARAGARVERRITDRIDRAFFPERYEARRALEELADRTRTAEDRPALASLLEDMLRSAFRPVSLAVYLEDPDGRLVAADLPAGPGVLARDAGPLTALASRARPTILPPPGIDDAADELHGMLAPLRTECLAPMVDRNGRLVGVVALGGRQSEEPYSGEDVRLLTVVSLQSALTVQTIGLSEEMAARIEASRRAEHEVEIAKEVQRQLLPASAPALAGFACAGACIQAKSVGGDYYDFVVLGAERIAILLADVAGKGIGAALLMANLQATLRSQYAAGADDPARLVERANRLFFASTPDDRYATLFLAEFNQATRGLRYVNCGHVPPLLARAGGAVETLDATGTVIGLFEDWFGESAATVLEPGDTLVVCSDGVTEAFSDNDEEFGEGRLRDAVAAHRHLAVPELLAALQTAVQRFSGAVQSDDLTLLVARATPPAASLAEAAGLNPARPA